MTTLAGKTIGQCLREIEQAKRTQEWSAFVRTMIRTQAAEAYRAAYARQKKEGK